MIDFTLLFHSWFPRIKGDLFKVDYQRLHLSCLWSNQSTRPKTSWWSHMGSLICLINVTKKVPSHILYADDIFILCTRKFVNIEALTNLFTSDSSASNHVFSLAKSTIFASSISSTRLNKISRMIDFSRGHFISSI